MKKIKKMILTAILGTTLLWGGTADAFDLIEDANTFTKDPNVAVTLYLGMSREEVDHNFDGAGWEIRIDERKDKRTSNHITKFRRIDKLDNLPFFEEEIIIVDYTNDGYVKDYRIEFNYMSPNYYGGEVEKLKEEDIKKLKRNAFIILRDITKNLTAALGKPDAPMRTDYLPFDKYPAREYSLQWENEKGLWVIGGYIESRGIVKMNYQVYAPRP